MKLSFDCLIAHAAWLLFSFLEQNEMPVITGAACGAAIYIMNMRQADKFRRLCYFLISFILGVNCAESVINLLNHEAVKFIIPEPEINKTFTAALTSAIAVRLINKISDLVLKKLTIKNNENGKNGDRNL